MLHKIKNINSKSFQEYSSNEELLEVNLFFGINGSGKSALSNWIYESNRDNSIKFDTNFVHQNIGIQNVLEGVKLTIGEEKIQRENLIKNIKQANTNIKDVNNTINNNIITNKEKLYKIIDQILNSSKNLFDFYGVNHKSHSKKDPLNAYKLWTKEKDMGINLPGNISGKEIENKTEELPIIINSLDKLFPWLDDDYKKKSAYIFDKKVVEIEKEMNNQLLKWLEEGLKIHETDSEHEQCRFCEQKFKLNEVRERITEKINTEYSQVLEFLNELQRNIEGSLLKVEKIMLAFDEEKIKKWKKVIQELNEQVENKLNNANESYDIADMLDNLIDIEKNIILKKEEYKLQLKEYRKLESKIDSVVKQDVSLKLSKNEEANKLFKDIKKDNKSIDKNLIAIADNSEVMKKWLDNDSNLNPFKEMVNKNLSNLGLDFYLAISPHHNESYVIKHIDPSINLQTKDLSEGELRILAFIYFYYSSFSRIDEKEHIVNSEINTFIIDDPITSLDNNNRYYITGMINKYLSEIVPRKSNQENQVFIFTHSSVDFHNIAYNFSKNKLKRWRVTKDLNGNSKIQSVSSDEYQNYSDYYKSVMLEVIDFSRTSKHKLDGKRNYLSYGNKGRFIIESHARSHYNIENVTSARIDQIMECYSINEKDKNKTIKALDIINSLSHGMSISTYAGQQANAVEVQSAIITIIKILYKKDKHHIDSIGKGSADYKDFKQNKLNN